MIDNGLVEGGMIKKRLFTPGPVSMYPPALAAGLDANLHHRTAEFRTILAAVVSSLRKLCGDPAHLYMLASSGSGAMEAAVTNFFSPGDPVIVASCGKFGERWIELTQRFGLRARVLNYPYGRAVEPSDIEKLLRDDPGIRGVFVQACESSTGVQNSIDSISSVVSRTEALLVVDAVSALATMPLSCASGIDVLLSGSQKALMIPPGIAFVAATQKAWRSAEASTMPRYYFDLRAANKAWEQNGQTPFTPATSLVLSLHQSLQAIEHWGLERLIELTANRARATRAGVTALGLGIFSESAPANALTAVAVRDNHADKITSELKQRFGLQVAGGQGDMKGKIFRISHMGFIDHLDLLGVLGALEITLQRLGHPIALGRSLEEFQKIYAEVA